MSEGATSYAVVGGGVLGMHLAFKLAQAGHDVTLYEAAPDLGGLASVWQIGDVKWDKHYHVVVPTDRRTIALIEELGLADQLTWRTVPAGCESEGVVHPATTPREILKLPFLGALAKARLGLTAARAAALRDPLSIEDVPVVEWLRRWSGSEATEKFWIPLLRSKLGSNVNQASATFIATTLRRLLGARRQGGATGDGFGFVSGGYATVLEKMAAGLTDVGVRSRLGERVTAVRMVADGLSVVTANGSHTTFNKVVVTAASPIAARLCPDLSEDERTRCTEVTYQGIVCLSVLLRRPLTRNYITYLMRPQPFTAVIDMSALVGTDQLAGHGLVYLPRYVRCDDPILEADEEDIVTSFLSSLGSVYSSFDRANVVATRLSKVRYVLPVPTLGYSRRLPPVRTSVPGLFLASSALITDGTLNIDETLGVVERVMPILAAR